MISLLPRLMPMLLVLLLAGCSISRHPAGIASSTAPVSPGYQKMGLVERASCSYSILFIPITGMDGPEQMIDELVKEKGAIALVGVTVEHSRYTPVLPLVSSECTAVRGQAVKGASK